MFDNIPQAPFTIQEASHLHNLTDADYEIDGDKMEANVYRLGKWIGIIPLI